jgi:hypothetical protein
LLHAWQIRLACIQTIDKIREHQGQKALTSTKTTTVVFGTSGWRGVIGEDFTMLNVHKTVRGIIDMMKTEDFLRYIAGGTNSYSQTQFAWYVFIVPPQRMTNIWQ